MLFLRKNKFWRFLFRRQPETYSWFSFFILIIGLFLLLVLLVLAPFFYHGLKIIPRLAQAENNAMSLLASARSGDWVTSRNRLDDLRENLFEINGQLEKLGPILYLPPVARNIRAANQLFAGADKLLTVYDRLFFVLSEMENDLQLSQIALGFGDLDQRRGLLKGIIDYRLNLMAISDDLDRAREEINQINTQDLLGIFQYKLLLVEYFMTEAIASTEVALPIFRHLPELLGYDQEKNYLFLFQNNMELRPTGGFIGSYGILTVRNGEVINIFTDDIYNLDKHAEGKMEELAPEPMARYNNQKFWYLRDANWSPDWPTSAEKIIWFFNQERNYAGLPPQELDGIIAITPDFIANLLSITGPVEIKNLTFKSDNFANDLEQFVEFDYVHYGIEKTERKAIIGLLTEIIINRLHGLSSNELMNLWLAFKKNIDEKHILVYLLDEELQRYFYDQNWSGVVKQVEHDYLMVVDSNLAALKTDPYIDRSISYNLVVNTEGDLIAKAEITYNHRGRFIPQLVTRYRTYTRIYVPAGSWFLKSYVKHQGTIQTLEILKDLVIGNELGKRYGAAFLVIEPGDSKTLILEYRLPENIKKQYQNGLYKFSVQKQPGTVGHNLKINLGFNQLIQAYHAHRPPVYFSGQEISWQTDLSKDRHYLIKF